MNNPLITAMLVAAFPYYNGFRNEPTYRNTIQTHEEGKKCLLPDCVKLTKHNGGYCSSDHCKLHKAKMKGTL